MPEPVLCICSAKNACRILYVVPNGLLAIKETLTMSKGMNNKQRSAL